MPVAIIIDIFAAAIIFAISRRAISSSLILPIICLHAIIFLRCWRFASADAAHGAIDFFFFFFISSIFITLATLSLPHINILF
jgi:hypothetical protein